VARRLDFLFIHTESGTFPLGAAAFAPPTGLVELASFLNSHGFRARVVDMRHSRFTIGWLADYLADAKPRWVGVSVFTDTHFAAARVVEIIRSASPSSRIALGGPHATALDLEVLAEMRPDAVVRGEGELPCLSLLTEGRLSDVRGIAHRRGRGLARTPPPPALDLDAKPAPDYGVIEGLAGLPYIPTISTGRGCPYRCTFCAASLSPNVRWRSVEKVVADIQAVMSKCHGKYVVISDDTFTLDPRRTQEFCDEISRAGGGKDLFWFAEGRVDRLAGRRELLRKMKDAGLRYLQIGIESGDPSVLEAYRKGIKLDDAVQLASECADEGILLHAGFIVGGPFESAETVRNTRLLIERLVEAGEGFFQCGIAFLTPFPGTAIYERPEEFGLEILDPPLLSANSFDNCVTRTKALSREEICDMRERLTAYAGDLMLEMFKGRGDEFHSHMEVLRSQLGAVHSALRMSAEPGRMEAMRKAQLARILERLPQYPLFRKEPGDFGAAAVPARLPLFACGADGRYRNDTLGMAPLSGIENDAFHYASGKLTARDIAVVLGRAEDEVMTALSSLASRSALIYRTV
jgi:radical SAM superfamily enzyme YgiQ (UPF0313 family)